MKGGIRLTAKNKHFWSLLILLLSVASITRKLLKTIHTEEHSAHTNSKSCNIRLGSLKNQFNFKQIIQILQPITIDYFSTHFFRLVSLPRVIIQSIESRDTWRPTISALKRSKALIFRRESIPTFIFCEHSL